MGGGFSLVELMLVLAVFGVLTATALGLILEANRSLKHRLRASTLVSNGLTALARMAREIRMAGSPSAASFTSAAVAARPGIVATSFVAASTYDLAFEADTDSDGRVEQIRYVLSPSSTSIQRSATLKSPDGTLDASTTVTATVLDNVQNQVQGRPLFTWDLDPVSPQPFPQNIRTVYLSVILAAGTGGSGGTMNVTLSVSCQRLNP